MFTLCVCSCMGLVKSGCTKSFRVNLCTEKLLWKHGRAGTLNMLYPWATCKMTEDQGPVNTQTLITFISTYNKLISCFPPLNICCPRVSLPREKSSCSISAQVRCICRGVSKPPGTLLQARFGPWDVSWGSLWQSFYISWYAVLKHACCNALDLFKSK